MQLKEYTQFHSRYELIRKLGSGGFSEVWLAEDVDANRMQVVLKVYAFPGGLDADGIKMFSREFSLLFNYNHSNLLKPTYFDKHENRPFLVMPFCENGSARKLVGDITEEAAWRLLRDVASGLAYLHSRSKPVIHQDLSPENILINDQGEFLITDFGISTVRNTLQKSAIDLQNSQAGGGKPDFMGPERFEKTNKPIKASDIWSLGATMYELLEGELPFPMGLGGLAQKGGAEIPEITGEYSKELKEMVYKMLAKETWDRPTAEAIKKEAEIHLNGSSGNTKLWQKLGFIAAIVLSGIIGYVVHDFTFSNEQRISSDETYLTKEIETRLDKYEVIQPVGIILQEWTEDSLFIAKNLTIVLDYLQKFDAAKTKVEQVQKRFASLKIDFDQLFKQNKDNDEFKRINQEILSNTISCEELESFLNDNKRTETTAVSSKHNQYNPRDANGIRFIDEDNPDNDNDKKISFLVEDETLCIVKIAEIVNQHYATAVTGYESVKSQDILEKNAGKFIYNKQKNCSVVKEKNTELTITLRKTPVSPKKSSPTPVTPIPIEK